MQPRSAASTPPPVLIFCVAALPHRELQLAGHAQNLCRRVLATAIFGPWFIPTPVFIAVAYGAFCAGRPREIRPLMFCALPCLSPTGVLPLWPAGGRWNPGLFRILSKIKSSQAL